MKIKPVKNYPGPDYPTREVLHKHPDLLRLVPQRWRKSVTVLAAVAFAYGMFISWRKLTENHDVAPIFKHGSGIYRSSVGCVSVTPPVFLSEEEARYVITDEAKRAGIAFTPTQHLINVKVPATHTSGLVPGTGGGAGGLEVDGQDTARNISFEFVSIDDFYEWKDEPVISESLIHHSTGWDETVKTRDTADRLRKALAHAPLSERVAVFYDPIADTSMEPEASIVEENGVVYADIPYLAQGLGMQVLRSGSGYIFMVGKMEYVVHKVDNTNLISINGKMVEGYVEGYRVGRRSWRFSMGIALKDFCKVLGATCTWDSSNHTATLTYPPTGKTLTLSVDGPLASKEALRQQVRDFINWLKAQGAI